MAKRPNRFENVGGNDANTSGGNDGASVLNFRSIETIDPAAIAAPDTTATDAGTDAGNDTGNADKPKRKYRKRGNSQAGEALSIEGLASILLSTHTLLAAVTKVEELAIDETEATQVANASVNVARHYGFSPSSKAVDWSNLIMALSLVYGTRIIAIRNRKKNKKKDEPEAQQETLNPLQWPVRG